MLERLNMTVDGNNVQSLNAGQYNAAYVTYCHCKSSDAIVEARDGPAKYSRHPEDGDESNTFF